MNADPANSVSPNGRPYRIVGLSYFSVYVKDFQEAIAFYGRVFGPPESVDAKGAIYGWRMGATWLTVFPSKIGTDHDGNPRKGEIPFEPGHPRQHGVDVPGGQLDDDKPGRALGEHRPAVVVEREV